MEWMKRMGRKNVIERGVMGKEGGKERRRSEEISEKRKGGEQL